MPEIINLFDLQKAPWIKVETEGTQIKITFEDNSGPLGKMQTLSFEYDNARGQYIYLGKPTT